MDEELIKQRAEMAIVALERVSYLSKRLGKFESRLEELLRYLRLCFVPVGDEDRNIVGETLEGMVASKKGGPPIRPTEAMKEIHRTAPVIEGPFEYVARIDMLEERVKQLEKGDK